MKSCVLFLEEKLQNFTTLFFTILDSTLDTDKEEMNEFKQCAMGLILCFNHFNKTQMGLIFALHEFRIDLNNTNNNIEEIYKLLHNHSHLVVTHEERIEGNTNRSNYAIGIASTALERTALMEQYLLRKDK